MQAFVIHHPSSTDREAIVKNIVDKTGARVLEAYLLPDGHEGCTRSHLKIAILHKMFYANEPYLVFEDDCVLEPGWDDILKQYGNCDIVYLGYTDACEHTIFGTHGLMMSPKARDILLSNAETTADKVQRKWAMDQILTRLAKDFQLQIAMPTYEERQKYAYQAKGLKSLITGNIRR